MIGPDQRILLELLMSGALQRITPPGSAMPGMADMQLMGATNTPGFGGPLGSRPPVGPPAPASPGGGLRDIWRGIGTTFQGEAVDPEIARQSRRGAIGDVGLALLSTAGRAPIGEAFPRALAAFRGGLSRENEAALKRKRETEEFDLSRRSVEEQISSSRAATKRADSEEGRQAKEYGFTEETRQGTREGMSDLVREIEEIAGKDSNEADRARALQKGGPKLYGDLEKLHKEILDRSTLPERKREETDAELEERRRIYKEDPGALFERNIKERTTAAYERQAGGRGGLSSSAYLSQLRLRTNQIYKARLGQAQKFGPGLTDPDFDHMLALQEAQQQAEAELAGAGYGPAGGGGAGGRGSERTGLPLVDTEVLGAPGNDRVHVVPGQTGALTPNQLQEAAAIRSALPEVLRNEPSSAGAIERLLAQGKSPQEILDILIAHAQSKGVI